MVFPITASLDIGGWRNDDWFEFALRVAGLDVSDLALAMDIRLSGDMWGPAIVHLDKVADDAFEAQGLRVAGVSIVDGVEITDLRIRMDRGTLQGFPYLGEVGDASEFAYAFLIGGRTRLVGAFILSAHPYGSDAAPEGRVIRFGGSRASFHPDSGATLTISQDGGATVVIDGADLVSAAAQQVAADVAQAAADREAVEAISSTSYRAVETYGDREAIPLDKRDNGMRVQVMQAGQDANGYVPRVFEWRTDLFAPGGWTGLLTQAELQRRELQTGKQNQDTINGLPEALSGLDQVTQNVLAGVKRNATLAISTFAALAASTAGPVDLSWAIGGVTPRVQSLSWGGWSIDLDGYARALTLGPWTDRAITVLGDSVSDGVTAAGTWALKAAAQIGQPLTTVALYSAGSKQAYRSGAKPLLLTLTGNRLPAGGASVAVTAINGAAPGSANPASPLFTYTGDTRALTITGTIAGRHVTMSATGGGSAYSLVADAGSTATDVPAASLFVPDFAQRMGRDELWIMVSHNHFYSEVHPQNINPQALADVDALVRQARGQRICIMGLLPDASWVPGTKQYAAVRAFNAELKRRYPAYYVEDAQGRDPLARMVASGNGSAADNADAANGVTPGSLRQDSQHPNDAGNAVLAALMLEFRARQAQPPAITTGTTFTLSADGDDGVGGSMQATAVTVPGISQLGQVVRTKAGAPAAGSPIWRFLNGLGFQFGWVSKDGLKLPGLSIGADGYSLPGTTLGPNVRPGATTRNPLGFVISGADKTRGFLLPGGYRWVGQGGGFSIVNTAGDEVFGFGRGRYRLLGIESRRITDASYREVNGLGFVTMRRSRTGEQTLGPIVSPTITAIRAQMTALAAKLGGTVSGFAPRSAPYAATVATHSDGRSLTRWRGRVARTKTSTNVARVMMTGDSWTEKTVIPQALATALGAISAGWISVFATGDVAPIAGGSFTSSGWTAYDASFSGAPIAAVGCSHEGHATRTTTATATASFTFSGTAFRLYYPQLAGAMRYRVDGGAWSAVPSDGSGALGIVSATGLTAGTHTVDVDTSTNTGGATAALFGFYYYTAGVAGIEVLKCGNSSIDATQFQTVIGRVAPIVANLAPDVIVIILGTNDARKTGPTPATMTTFLSAYVAEVRGVLPDCGFIIVSPPRNGEATPSFTLAQYRDAVSDWCYANGCEHLNMHDEWATYAVEQAAGQWLDTLHLNTAGAYRLAASILRRFLSL